jgi:hypothetical protein
MPVPTDAKALLRFIGMANYLSKFIPNFSALTLPLRSLLKTDVQWFWSSTHDDAFHKIKHLVASAPTLRYFDRSLPVVIQTDASSAGIGCCLLQADQPIAFASRALTDAETRYAQIEKELMAVLYACEKFSHYIYGHHTIVQSDHKPLEVILRKPLSQTTPRLQRMLLRLLKFQIEICYTPGKQVLVADALSRAYLSMPLSTADREMAEDIEVIVHSLVTESPISTLIDFKAATADDPTLSQLLSFVRSGFPANVSTLMPEIRAYHSIAADLHEVDGVLYYGNRVIVPVSGRAQVLSWIHEGHLGRDKSKALARASVYWPAMAKDIEALVSKCSTCNSFQRVQQKEPLMPHDVPSRPWQKVGADIFTLFGNDYLLIVDYFSKFPEMALLSSKTASGVTTHLKSIFSRHGIPEILVADNMPFDSFEMRQFATEWNFTIVTSSPRYAQSNGQAERCVQTVKMLLKKSADSGNDPYIALMQYRNAPLAGLMYSPAQLLFGRSLRTKLPSTSTCLQPNRQSPRDSLVEWQRQQKERYDLNARALPPLQEGDAVRVKHNSQWLPAVVLEQHATPRSYIVATEDGSTLRRNRRHLNRTSESPVASQPTVDDDYPMSAASPSATPLPCETTSSTSSASSSLPSGVTRSGRTIKPPVRFSDYT